MHAGAVLGEGAGQVCAQPSTCHTHHSLVAVTCLALILPAMALTSSWLCPHCMSCAGTGAVQLHAHTLLLRRLQSSDAADTHTKFEFVLNLLSLQLALKILC